MDKADQRSNPNRTRLWRRAVLGAIGVLALVGCAIGANTPEQRAPATEQPGASSVNLLADARWNLDGVTTGSNGNLQVRHSGKAIVRQNGTPGYNNPAVNLYGTSLEHSGDFSLQARLGSIKGPARLTLYGEAPIVEDEFVAAGNALTLSIENDQLDAEVSTKGRGRAVEHRSFELQPADNRTVEVAYYGNHAALTVDGEDVGEIPTHDIFLSKQLLIGLHAPRPDGSFDVNALTATSVENNTVRAVDTSRYQVPALSRDGLATLAGAQRPGFLLGAAVATGQMTTDERYRQRLFKNVNSFTTENAGKWQTVHPRPGNSPEAYDFTEMDAIVDMAQRSNRSVHGHTLIFGEANPQWVQDLAGKPDELRQAAVDHITTVMTHYAGKVDSWDVINEPFADYDTPQGQNGLRKNIWYQALGPGYIETMLRAAHQADPKAGLWINEFGLETDTDRFNRMLGLVDRLQANGVPLTGIGLQSHIDAYDTIDGATKIDETLLRARINALEARGLKTRFSEVDVSNKTEHAIPAQLLRVCLAETACQGVTLWGVSDAVSSGGSIDRRGIYQPGTGLPWDKSYAPTAIANDITKILNQ